MAALPTLIKLTTPLDDKVLNFSTMTAVEEMGRLFDYELAVLGERNDIDPKKLLGKRCSIALELSDKSYRYFNGIVTSFGLDGAQGKLFSYGMTLRPWLWLLSRGVETRIFQNQSVPDILKAVFGRYPADVKFELKGTYPPREYCVQYRESDFNFASRLMEQEGIYYFFKHTAEQHLMVLADKATVHVPVPDHAEFRYRAQSLGAIEYEAISEWRFSEEIQPGKVSLDDYDFTQPSTELQASYKKDRGHTGSNYEHYDPPGNYLTKSAGERYAQLRIEELHARYTMAAGFGTMSALTTGYRFRMTEHPRADQNREHIVVSTRIKLRHAGYEAGAEGEAAFTCHFTALDSREVFRPQRTAPKPVVPGPHTARVVGPAGDEIHTDAHGRIKVQFHWDREGKKDENSSCWMRVATPWAGKGFGMISLPRIGHEVVVEFLEGDPDRPLVTGSVYNGENNTPYVLPDHATVSTMKSRSSKGGAVTDFNELRFEDAKGKEYVFMQAERNELHLVKRNRTTSIGADEFLTVQHQRKENIVGNQQLAVGGNMKTDVKGSKHTLVTGDVLTSMDGEHGLSARKAINMQALHGMSFRSGRDFQVESDMRVNIESAESMCLKAGFDVVIEANFDLTLKCGPSSIVIGQTGISITGPMIFINSGGVPGEGAPNAAEYPAEGARVDPEDQPPGVKDPLPHR